MSQIRTPLHFPPGFLSHGDNAHECLLLFLVKKIYTQILFQGFFSSSEHPPRLCTSLFFRPRAIHLKTYIGSHLNHYYVQSDSPFWFWNHLHPIMCLIRLLAKRLYQKIVRYQPLYWLICMEFYTYRVMAINRISSAILQRPRLSRFYWCFPFVNFLGDRLHPQLISSCCFLPLCQVYCLHTDGVAVAYAFYSSASIVIEPTCALSVVGMNIRTGYCCSTRGWLNGRSSVRIPMIPSLPLGVTIARIR